MKCSFSHLLDAFNVSVVRHFCFIGIILILILSSISNHMELRTDIHV